MKRLNTYQKFFESRKVETILESFGMLLESDEAAGIVPAQAQSEKEILEEMPEEEKKKIEDILAKYFPETKGKLDVDNLPSESGEGEKKEGEGEKKEGEGEKTNEEAGILLAITIASLIPAAMEAVGSLANLFKRKFGINLDEKQMENLKKLNEGITALNSIKAGKEGKFMSKSYNMETFKEISNILAKELATPELEFGKGYEDDHGHSDKKEESKPEGEQVKEAQKDDDLALNKVDAELDKELAKYKKFRDKLFGSNFGNWLKEKGHDLHHAYTAPIRGVLWTISLATKKDSKLRDEKIREKVANVLYAIAMISLAGYGIMSSLGSLSGVGEISQVLLKGVEGGVNLGELRKQALTALLGGA